MIEKELLHHFILQALDEAGYLRKAVFQGGTCLRLCHGAERFSEDLDFACGRGFDTADMAGITDCLSRKIGDRFGLPLTFREPKLAADRGPQSVPVATWTVIVQTAPENRSLPSQRIKIEFAAVPAHTRELTPLRTPYRTMQGMADILIPTESLTEILADKALALPLSLTNEDGTKAALNSHRIRHRDIWDIAWLLRRNAALSPELVMRKAQDYAVPAETLAERYAAAVTQVPHVVRSPEYLAQMRRFIEPATLDRTLLRTDYLDYLSREITGVLNAVSTKLDTANPEKRRTARRESASMPPLPRAPSKSAAAKKTKPR
ncbi:nucleotidyl transferase AbiEii/AbiGii toxin family protein [Oleiharenicola sp. Vm1]|uniref:nucleotidyl transferase AbiEii/AbiGii toxin family protein n=1 Tax=Oleiharenicola sp. Vm1 TaxID=3398393 RepID=UPI0039F5BA17